MVKNKNKFIGFNSLVVYHNKLNLVPLTNFTPLEHNLLFSLLKDMKHNDDQLDYYWTIAEIKDIIKKSSPTIEDIVRLVESLKAKFFHCAFEIILPKSNGIYHLFSHMRIDYLDEEQKQPKGLEISINKAAIDIFKNLKKSFTSFDIDEFKRLKSSYSKTLFRLLSQYSSVGKYKVEYDVFRKLLSVPEAYDYRYFNAIILKPSIRELSRLFKNLNVEVIKDRENGRLVHKFLVFNFKSFGKITKETIEVSKPKSNTTLFALKLSKEKIIQIANYKASKQLDYSEESKAVNLIDKVRDYEIAKLNSAN